MTVTATNAGGAIGRATATTGLITTAPPRDTDHLDDPTASTGTPTTPTTPTNAPAAPVRLRITGISATGPAIVWCQDKGCRYPPTRLRFALNQATTVRLLLRTRARGHWTQVASTTLQGHRGVNRHRIAGRWHGHLFPTGPVQILIQI